MSKITEALAKAKERTGTTTAPFFVPGATAPVANPVAEAAKAKALRKAQNAQRFWLGLLSIAAVLTALVIWNRLKPGAAELARSEDPVPSAEASVAPSVRQAPSVPDPRVELYNTVNSLVITAVLPGERPRLMYKGRIVSIGEKVEDELVFAGVEDGRLVFNDRRGATYTRRY